MTKPWTREMNLRQDPHPECTHRWIGEGCTTITEPPIFHSSCQRCRTFRHQRDKDLVGDGDMETWYTLQWPFGPYTWPDGTPDI